MRKINLKNYWGICLAAVALCMSFTSCNKNDDDKLPSWADFVEFNITRCERVGGVLMVDFTITNKKDNTLQVDLDEQTVTDNVGKTYRTLVWGSSDYETTAIAMNNDKFFGNTSFTLVGKGSAKGHLKVYDFNPTNSASSVSVRMDVGIENVTLGNSTYGMSNIKLTDNRVKEHGVQTNDSKLAYQVTSCTYDEGNVDVTFTLTNNTGATLRDLYFNEESDRAGYKAYDDLGNNYTAQRGTRFLSLNGEEWVSVIETNIPAGGSISVTARVTDVRSNANEISLSFLIGSEYYVFEDNTLRFLSIPIEKE
ncbi:MAG: hypothetical protein IJ914_03800 [Prevotella sp.]|nr:hypothetical protein [Prevotella sp.]